MKITFIFCVYNEYNNLKKNLKKLKMLSRKDLNSEIIVIE